LFRFARASVRLPQAYFTAAPEARGAINTTPAAIFVDFAYLFLASLALGVAFGLGTAFLLKLLDSHSTPQVLCPSVSLHRPAHPPIHLPLCLSDWALLSSARRATARSSVRPAFLRWAVHRL
jgi:hypothetical protein